MHQKKIKIEAKIASQNHNIVPLKIPRKRGRLERKIHLRQKKMNLNRTRSPIQLTEKTDDPNMKCEICKM